MCRICGEPTSDSHQSHTCRQFDDPNRPGLVKDCRVAIPHFYELVQKARAEGDRTNELKDNGRYQRLRRLLGEDAFQGCIPIPEVLLPPTDSGPTRYHYFHPSLWRYIIRDLELLEGLLKCRNREFLSHAACPARPSAQVKLPPTMDFHGNVVSIPTDDSQRTDADTGGSKGSSPAAPTETSRPATFQRLVRPKQICRAPTRR